MTLVWLGALLRMRALGRTGGTDLIVGEKGGWFGADWGGGGEVMWIVRTAGKSRERGFDSGCGASNNVERRSGPHGKRTSLAERWLE